MYSLAIDASSKRLSYCIKENDFVVCEYDQIVKNGASQLAWRLEKDFKRLRLSINDFDFFIVGAGPGSFTGLRISFSLVKAFVLVSGKNVFSLNSFFACAYPFRKKAGKIVVLADAKKNLVYGASFLSSKEGIKQEVKPKLTTLEFFLNQKKDYLFLTYDQSIRNKIMDLDSRFKIWPRNIYPRAKYLIEGFGKNKLKNRRGSLNNFKPLYLHSITCQVSKGGAWKGRSGLK